MKKSIYAIFVFMGTELGVLAQDTQGSNAGSFLKSITGSNGGPQVDFAIDGLFSDDIEVLQSQVSFEQALGPYTLTGSVGQVHSNVDVSVPRGTQLSGIGRTRRDDGYSYQLGLEKQISKSFALGLTGSYTDGFVNHRSLWIAQLNTALDLFDEFSQPDPQSLTFGLNSKWDYSNRGSIAVSANFSQARVVPLARVQDDANEISGPPGLEDVNEIFNTYSGNIIWEVAIAPKINSQHTLSLSRTDGRELNARLQSDWAFSLSKNLTLRAQIGAATENPTFEAIYGGLTFVYELNDQWQFELGGRYYEDTGEINTENFNTAAPGVTTNELSIGALWKQGDTSVRVSAGIYDIDFDPITNPENLPFLNLYRDRDFVTTRLAISHSF